MLIKSPMKLLVPLNRHTNKLVPRGEVTTHGNLWHAFQRSVVGDEVYHTYVLEYETLFKKEPRFLVKTIKHYPDPQTGKMVDVDFAQSVYLDHNTLLEQKLL